MCVVWGRIRAPDTQQYPSPYTHIVHLCIKSIYILSPSQAITIIVTPLKGNDFYSLIGLVRYIVFAYNIM